MQPWLRSALAYIPDWLDMQMRTSEQPGVAVAIAEGQEVVFEHALGHANLDTGEKLTPRHRMRVASHSKSFTATGIMKLRESGKLSLDDAAGKFVPGLHADAAKATVQQLISHSAGLTRDGTDAGQFHDRKAFLSREEMLADLARPPPLGVGEAFKYSNHGFALAGMIIEKVTGEDYSAWIRREVVDALGLKETEPEFKAERVQPFARGHSMKQPFGRRLVIPGDSPGRAIASAGAFVSTAGDLCRLYASLSPTAARSLLSPASRRDMCRRHWRDRHSVLERYYGLGIMASPPGPWEYFGHGGSWQGYLSRSATIPDKRLTVSVLTNAVDGLSQPWFDGVMHILRAFEEGGAASASVAGWTGRYWGLWSPLDLVPMGDKVLVANPTLAMPFTDASEITPTGKDAGRVSRAQAYGDYAEPARLDRDGRGAVTAFWIGGKEMKPEAPFKAEFEAKYARKA